MTFRMAPKYEIEDLGTDGERRYLIRAKLYSMKHGIFLGEGIGEASTLEDKYAWEKATDAEYDEEVDPMRRRIKHYRDYDQKQVRANVADRSNTVLKMGKKRALVDAVLTVTAASDMFTQDLDEDDVANMARNEAEAAKEQQQPKAKPKAKEKPVLILPYGAHKGLKVTDPAVSIEHLTSLADGKQRAIDAGKVDPKFLENDKLFVAALRAEVTARQAASKPEPAQGATETGNPKETTAQSFNDSAWVDFITVAEEEYAIAYAEVKRTFGVQSGHDVPAAKRWDFYRHVEAAHSKLQK